MSHERWEQISRIYHAALEAGDEDRGRFLAEACAGDPDLRAEVESLLSKHGQAGGFLGNPAIKEMASQLGDGPPSLLGRKLGPYQMLGLIGSGGMGEVYKALDTRLNRSVAIKVLPRHLSEQTDLRRRFEQDTGSSRAPCRSAKPCDLPPRSPAPWSRHTDRA
ncbi:MAG: prkC 29 [Acidobacteria bacterium]|nr:prkC 29 [Acidobacteriota bacterium]